MDAVESGTVEYLSCVQTAAMFRRVLKAAFPGVRFSVRSDVYSGGASIDIKWTDGPNREAVEAVVQHYEGATFDGMTDLKTHHDTVLVGPAGPRLVALGCDFIFAHRTVTDERRLTEEAKAMIRARCATEGEPPLDRFGSDWVANLAAGMVHELDLLKGETLEVTFRRVVLRERP